VFERIAKAAVSYLRGVIASLGGGKPLRGALTLAAFAGVLLVGGVVAGDWMSDHEVKAMVLDALANTPMARERAARQAAEATAHQTVYWRPLDSALHDLETATVKLAPFETFGDGGAIEELDGNILYASPVGDLGYLTPGLEMKRLDLKVPVNFDDLERSPIYTNPGFIAAWFRVLDLLAVERAPGEYDLYASHHRFADECFEVVVDRATLIVDGDEIRAASPDWEEIFVATPCVPTKDMGGLFQGNEAGGRIVLKDDATLLLSLGDLEFNGVDNEHAFSQDLATDFGKIIEIDRTTHAHRFVSIGHRNPQGLLVARDGAVWETEHGPEGGDEINIIREGANYGWPYATYGVHYSYGGPRRDWPMSTVQGSHDGYELPAFSFVPSIGVSNIVQPDAREFPLWEHHMLVGSLSRWTLFLVRIEGERAVYAEPIALDGEIRDLIVLDDGRFAVLTDEGELVLIRNAERHAEGEHGPLVVNASPEVAAILSNVEPPPSDVAAEGREYFQFWCVTCHSLAGAVGAGPPLDGVVGRPIASVEGFGYTAGMSALDGVWTEQRLRDFLLDPSGEVPGTAMPRVEVSRRQASALVEFLKQDD
jgi:cytochrome c2